MKYNNIEFKEHKAKDFYDFAMVVTVDFVNELMTSGAIEWWRDAAVCAGTLSPETPVLAYEDYMALQKQARMK